MDLWTPGIHRCAGFNASRPFRRTERKVLKRNIFNDIGQRRYCICFLSLPKQERQSAVEARAVVLASGIDHLIGCIACIVITSGGGARDCG